MKKERSVKNKMGIIIVILSLTLTTLILSVPAKFIFNIIKDERNKMKYPGIVQDELFYKYFTKVDESSWNSPVGKIRNETYIFNVKVLYDDLGYTQKINELNEKYKDRGINLVIPESDDKYYASESTTFSSIPPEAKSALYKKVFEGTFLYDEKIIDPDELMNLNSIQNSSVKSIMPSIASEGPSSIDERTQKFSKDGQKIRTVDDIINNIDYKKAVHESTIGLEYIVSTKKTEKDIIVDSSNDNLDNSSYKNNPEYVKTREAIQKELDEKYSTVTLGISVPFYGPKSETLTKTYDYSDPNYDGI
jgi:hypothetical protein